MILDISIHTLPSGGLDIRVNRDTAEFIARACHNQNEVPGSDIAFAIDNALLQVPPRETTDARSHSPD